MVYECPIVQIDSATFYKSGCIKEAEIDEIVCVHVYFNQFLPATLDLNPGQFSKSFFFMMTVDTDKSKAFEQFQQAKILLEMDGIGEILAEGK